MINIAGLTRGRVGRLISVRVDNLQVQFNSVSGYHKFKGEK